jgi:hypothetical protein
MNIDDLPVGCPRPAIHASPDAVDVTRALTVRRSTWVVFSPPRAIPHPGWPAAATHGCAWMANLWHCSPVQPRERCACCVCADHRHSVAPHTPLSGHHFQSRLAARTSRGAARVRVPVAPAPRHLAVEAIVDAGFATLSICLRRVSSLLPHLPAVGDYWLLRCPTDVAVAPLRAR